MTTQEQQQAILNGLGELKLSLHSCDGKTQQHKRLGPDDKAIILAFLADRGAVLMNPAGPEPYVPLVAKVAPSAPGTGG